MSIEAVRDLQGFFASAVDEAAERCGVSPEHGASAHLSTILASAASPEFARDAAGSVVLALDEALQAQRSHGSTEGLRALGDRTLYLVGFMPEFAREAQRPLFIHVGSFAYQRASQGVVQNGPTPELLTELGARFVRYSEVLAEVAVAVGLGATARDMVKLYDRWKQSNSPSALEALAEQGVFPGAMNGDA
ncbi:MAG: hypothetical protein Q8Q09_23380 [Deltaproteobacteria bacterium]|nr:hypothetical protein [Deltaproteobacteria bacterium]